MALFFPDFLSQRRSPLFFWLVSEREREALIFIPLFKHNTIIHISPSGLVVFCRSWSLSLSLSGVFGGECEVVEVEEGENREKNSSASSPLTFETILCRCSLSLCPSLFALSFGETTPTPQHGEERAVLRVLHPRARCRPGRGAAFGESFFFFQLRRLLGKKCGERSRRALENRLRSEALAAGQFCSKLRSQR